MPAGMSRFSDSLKKSTALTELALRAFCQRKDTLKEKKLKPPKLSARACVWLPGSLTVLRVSGEGMQAQDKDTESKPLIYFERPVASTAGGRPE